MIACCCYTHLYPLPSEGSVPRGAYANEYCTRILEPRTRNPGHGMGLLFGCTHAPFFHF